MELELGMPAYNALCARGGESVDDLLRLSAEQVAALPDMDQQAFDEIVDALAEHGLSLTSVG